MLGRKFSHRFLKSLSEIHIASACGLEVIILELLKIEANINCQDETGWTPLVWAVSRGHISTAILLLEKEADEDLGDKAGRVPIHHAARRGSTQFVELLAKRELNIDRKNNIGETPLHLAASEGHVEVVRLLLAKNAIVDLPDKKGRSALHKAVQGQHSDTVDALLCRNANPTQPDSRGETVMHLAAKEGNIKVFKQLLTAIRLASSEMLSKSSANATSAEISFEALQELRDKNGRMLLHIASMGGRNNIVKLLLIDLANTELTDKTGWPPTGPYGLVHHHWSLF